MACTITLQLKWLNDGLQHFDALYTVPVFQVRVFDVHAAAHAFLVGDERTFIE